MRIACEVYCIILYHKYGKALWVAPLKQHYYLGFETNDDGTDRLGENHCDSQSEQVQVGVRVHSPEGVFKAFEKFKVCRS